jgi:ornithine cyclodeaminase/alanine dehydrogenase-like protein (mu-crystallin family)
MIHLTEEQVRTALPMSEAVELVEEAFRRLDDGTAINHPRRRIVLADHAVMHAMEAGDNRSGLLGSKLYVTKAGVGARFIVTLFDARKCELLATIDANALGQIRTGAASGVATRHMARSDARRVAIIGSGFQAQTQLEAVAAVRPLEQAWVYSRTPERREKFAAKMSARLGLSVAAVDSARAAVQDADIVCSITSSREPVIERDSIAPGTHINAAGSNHARRAELDARTLAAAGVLAADSVEQARLESGELIQAVEAGAIDWQRVVEFSSIVAGRAPGRSADEQITVFASQGLAVEDLLVAEHVYRKLSKVS